MYKEKGGVRCPEGIQGGGNTKNDRTGRASHQQRTSRYFILFLFHFSLFYVDFILLFIHSLVLIGSVFFVL